MDELRLVRREDRSLVVATDSGAEYRLVVDETVLAELRHLARPPRSSARINPREVQAMIRAGRTREEVARATGAEESDIERYEQPVLAERGYILERAHAVPVRTSPDDAEERSFGEVIAERLLGLGAENAEWSSWRDEEAGWMIGLDFTSHEVQHRAVWSFEHRRGLLQPSTTDAVTLSKQGDVGDRLIPKLRAVDAHDRFDSGTFDPDALVPPEAVESGEPLREEGLPLVSGPVSPDHPSTGSIPIIDVEAEYARRQHIEERAIKTPATELPDLGQTADLLDALRRRRGERDAAAHPPVEAPQAFEPNEPVLLPGLSPVPDPEPAAEAPEHDTAELPAPVDPEPRGAVDEERPKRGKGRTSIPSWDDILFGTRSDEDPA